MGKISRQTMRTSTVFFLRILDSNSEDFPAQSCPRVNSEHIPVLPMGSLAVLNPDFTGVIRKSGYFLLFGLSKEVHYNFKVFTDLYQPQSVAEGRV